MFTKKAGLAVSVEAPPLQMLPRLVTAARPPAQVALFATLAATASALAPSKFDRRSFFKTAAAVAAGAPAAAFATYRGATAAQRSIDRRLEARAGRGTGRADPLARGALAPRRRLTRRRRLPDGGHPQVRAQGELRDALPRQEDPPREEVAGGPHRPRAAGLQDVQEHVPGPLRRPRHRHGAGGQAQAPPPPAAAPPAEAAPAPAA